MPGQPRSRPASAARASRTKGSKRLHKTLTESASAAARDKATYLSTQYGRLDGRRGPSKATGALRHSILVAAYHILERRFRHQELRADYFDQRRSLELRTKRLFRQLEHLGTRSRSKRFAA